MSELDEQELMARAMKLSPPRTSDRLDEDTDFLVAVIRLVKGWLNKYAGDERIKQQPQCLFLLAKDSPLTDPRVDDSGAILLPLAVLEVNFEYRVLVCDRACQHGIPLHIDSGGGQAISKYVVDNALGNSPHVIFDPAATRLHVMDSQSCQEYLDIDLRESDSNLTLELIRQKIRNFHLVGTQAPSGKVRIWEDAASYKLEKLPERRVQNALYLFLHHLQSIDTVMTIEFDTDSGRADLMILHTPPYGPSSKFGLVIELKAIKPTDSANQCNAVLSDGLSQCHDYVSAKSAFDTGWLCYFDASKKHSDPSMDVIKKAVDLNISLEQFRIFNHMRHGVTGFVTHAG